MERKNKLAAALEEEPEAGEGVTRIGIRLPNGDRLIRRFKEDDTLQSLYDFAEIQDLEPMDLLSDFVIVNTYPRLEYSDKTVTFVAAGLTPNATVVVEEIDEDE